MGIVPKFLFLSGLIGLASVSMKSSEEWNDIFNQQSEFRHGKLMEGVGCKDDNPMQIKVSVRIKTDQKPLTILVEKTNSRRYIGFLYDHDNLPRLVTRICNGLNLDDKMQLDLIREIYGVSFDKTQDAVYRKPNEMLIIKQQPGG